MKFYKINQSKPVILPVYGSFVRAGFPSPADDFMEGEINLNDLIDHPSSTFMVRAEGDSMVGAGIHSGDLLVVDKSKDPYEGDVIVAIYNGEFTVKRFIKKNNKIYLQAENIDFKNIEITNGDDFEIWGVVTCVLHNPNSRPHPLLT